MRSTIAAFTVLFFAGCSDDGHVVGDMAAGGSSGAPTGSNGNGSGNGNSTSGTSSSTTGTTGTGASSGSGGTANSTAGSQGGTGGATSSTDSDSGGAAGDPTSGSGGSGGACATGEVWCPGCYAGEGACYAGGCPASACADCAEVQTEEDCDARVDCHPVYQDLGTCGCGTPGCCTHFSVCAPGATADCEVQNTDCEVATPLCENPVFVISYANNCYEGCVKPEQCAVDPTVCPCPDCAEGEAQCLDGDACVLSTGPVGNGICRNSDGTCSTCRCTSPDTPIATASGNREIQDLRVGDLVYSVHEKSIQLVPIKLVNRIPVVNHHVLRVEFASGAKFEMSATHPTASGKPLSAFGVGDELMGERILAVTRIPYLHSHTYDILPDSDTGTYFADGVLVGSTLLGQ